MDWDTRYAQAAGSLFGDRPNVWLTMALGRGDVQPGSMLLLADGDGRNGTWVARRGLAVTGLDLSTEATRLARARDAAAGVQAERIVADLMDWSPAPGRRWESAAILFLHGPEPVRARAMALAAGALAPGGWLILEGFSEAQAGEGMGPRDADRLYGAGWLAAAASRPGLEVHELMSGRVRLDEGAAHRGEAAVVRLLARRPVA